VAMVRTLTAGLGNPPAMLRARTMAGVGVNAGAVDRVGERTANVPGGNECGGACVDGDCLTATTGSHLCTVRRCQNS
jgi:hypothetical protein